jgi:hypothetical protein
MLKSFLSIPWTTWLNLFGLTVFVFGLVLLTWRISRYETLHWLNVALLIFGFLVQVVALIA